MSKLFNFIKTKFLNKSFITFCIIGVMNTLINFFVMKGVLKIFDVLSDADISTKDSGFIYYVSMGVSTLVAFVAASVFSYFANAKFTYKAKKKDSKTFLEAFIAFVGRFILTYVFTLIIWRLLTLIFKIDTDPSGWLRTLSNLIASVCMIPPFYLVLGFVFRRSKERIEKAETEEQNKSEN